MKSGEVWVCTRRSARNLSYQGFMEQDGDPAVLLDLTGQDILGLPLSAPLAHYQTIYTLPMLTIKVEQTLGLFITGKTFIFINGLSRPLYKRINSSFSQMGKLFRNQIIRNPLKRTNSSTL